MYGITETTVHVTHHRLRQADCGAGASPSIGRPIAGVRVYVVDAWGHLAPRGVVGELCIGGAGVGRGYLGREDLTAERFVPDTFAGIEGARMYRTGDVARFRSDGNLEYLGRSDSQVKVRGYRIELGEVEAALSTFEGVTAAAVALQEDETGVGRLVGYVVGELPSLERVRTHLRRTLPEYMVPGQFVELDCLPTTQNGKIDRRALPAPDYGRPGLDVEYVAPRDDIEQTLANVWATVLRVERVGIHDNFFDLGGDSILSVQIVARAAGQGLKLTPRQVFEGETVAACRLVVESVFRPDERPVVGSTPLSPQQNRVLAARDEGIEVVALSPTRHL